MASKGHESLITRHAGGVHFPGMTQPKNIMERYSERTPKTDKFYISINGKKTTFREVLVKQTFSLNFHDASVELFIFKACEEAASWKWNVSEAQTGKNICTARTQKEAIKTATEIFLRKEQEISAAEFFKVFEKCPLSPRYKKPRKP